MTSRERNSTTLVKDCSGVFFFLFYGDLHFFVEFALTLKRRFAKKIRIIYLFFF